MNEAQMQKMAAAPASQKSFTGQFVVTHTVRQGETLARIAKIYLRDSWQPIWVYNSEVEHTIADEDALQQGATLFIPRTLRGYDLFINRLKNLRDQVEMQGKGFGYELEGLLDQLKANKVAVNAIADGLAVLVSLGIKVASAAKFAAAAEHAAGQAKIAARVTARAATRDLAESYAQSRSRLLRTALKADLKFVKAIDAVRETRQGLLVDTLVKAGDARLNSALDKEDGKTLQHAKNVVRGALLIREVTRGAATVAHTVKGVAAILIDYLEPAAVAEFILQHVTGESAEGAIETRIKMVEKNTENMLASLDEKIEHYSDECKLLYG